MGTVSFDIKNWSTNVCFSLLSYTAFFFSRNSTKFDRDDEVRKRHPIELCEKLHTG